MKIVLNARPIEVDYGETPASLKKRFCPDADTAVVNGYPAAWDLILQELDEVVLFRKGRLPKRDELEYLMAARHTPHVHRMLKEGAVAIAGCGGLGSNIAVALARSGVGKLLLIDFDIVEPTNLNRQHYFIEHLGRYKVDALKEQIGRINPFIEVKTRNIRLDEQNIPTILAGYPIVAEALDHPESKAMLVGAILEKLPGVKVVSGSGMAGLYDANLIRTSHPLENLYVCGDGVSEARPGDGLMSPRVMVCAGHQANMILRLLCKEEPSAAEKR
ncbi:sulfur carrier protein ThiS adenylyltransferase ThiF [Candidatus Soleaferrea massiliensis]|uniref:sulfur carrier protein ThiS adenylyltransferase ThiF n=1 Tax=Candidatus Soleaferrea massiliensis TaxID=1470354 RepID=UPI00058B287E|nr:sulfur carrier protein ThiS adenylyltransferase ThiF [Candidatus Soleaferrea massiliensis]